MPADAVRQARQAAEHALRESRYAAMSAEASQILARCPPPPPPSPDFADATPADAEIFAAMPAFRARPGAAAA